MLLITDTQVRQNPRLPFLALIPKQPAYTFVETLKMQVHPIISDDMTHNWLLEVFD